MSTNEFLRQKLKKSVPPYFSSKALSDKQMQSRIKKTSPQLILAIVGNACEIYLYLRENKFSFHFFKKRKKNLGVGRFL